jgi:hypothetical protein
MIFALPCPLRHPELISPPSYCLGFVCARDPSIPSAAKGDRPVPVQRFPPATPAFAPRPSRLLLRARALRQGLATGLYIPAAARATGPGPRPARTGRSFALIFVSPSSLLSLRLGSRLPRLFTFSRSSPRAVCGEKRRPLCSRQMHRRPRLGIDCALLRPCGLRAPGASPAFVRPCPPGPSTAGSGSLCLPQLGCHACAGQGGGAAPTPQSRVSRPPSNASSRWEEPVARGAPLAAALFETVGGRGRGAEISRPCVAGPRSRARPHLVTALVALRRRLARFSAAVETFPKPPRRHQYPTSGD